MSNLALSSLKNLEFEKYFKKELQKIFPHSKTKAETLLKKSMLHTLCAPSSHFRSLLAIETTKLFVPKGYQKIFPWALALEMFHSGSLIHDDLPLMDDGQKRRNKKCNHLVFGEDISLLAGSCLFVESFRLLTQPVFKKKASEILNLFISKTGFKGVMLGQCLDLKLKRPSQLEVLKMMELKTGSLIEAAIQGPALLFGKNKKEILTLKHFSKSLGMAYQLADDLQDQDSFLKQKEGVKLLQKMTRKSLQCLDTLNKDCSRLKDLVYFNEKKSGL